MKTQHDKITINDYFMNNVNATPYYLHDFVACIRIASYIGCKVGEEDDK